MKKKKHHGQRGLKAAQPDRGINRLGYTLPPYVVQKDGKHDDESDRD